MTGPQQEKRKRDILFFTLNGLGWAAWGLAQHLSYSLYEKDNRFAAVNFAAAIAGFVLTTALRYLCRPLWTKRPIIMSGGALLAAGIATLPMRLVINLAQQDVIKQDYTFEHWYDFILMGDFRTGPILICWMGLYIGLRFYESNGREREAALHAMALAQAAQLKMLRYQLNPHFLFNTLNAISTLILDQKNAVANTVVTRLADFLRYTLDQDSMKTVMLTHEIAALNLYLEIEKMRFGSRLTVTVTLDPVVGAIAVPSLILQPLIENAVKYAVSPKEQGGCICIDARLDPQHDSQIQLSVSDDGPGLIDTSRIESGQGVGLRNTRERLQVMYGAAASVEAVNLHPGLRVTLAFPAHAAETK